MGKISINLECNSIEEAKALLDFLAGYRKEQKEEDKPVQQSIVSAPKEDSETPVSEPPKPADDDKPVTAEDISRFAVSLLRQGKGAEIKRLLAVYNAKAFTDLPKDKMAVFLKTLQRL